MFKYGKKAGYMGIALLVLAVIPLVVAACVIPNIGPEVATKFNAAGEVTRWGKSYELLALPVLYVLLSVATYFTAATRLDSNANAVRSSGERHSASTTTSVGGALFVRGVARYMRTEEPDIENSCVFGKT